MGAPFSTRRNPTPPLGPAVLAILTAVVAASPSPGQETLERTANLDTGWIGSTGLLYIHLPYRLMDDPVTDGLAGVPTLGLGLSIPGPALLGARVAPGSPIAADRPEEWELFGRIFPMQQATGGPADVTVAAGVNGAARSLDAELALGRWTGPARFLATGRVLGNAYDSGDTRFAVAGGMVLHPLPRRAPIAVAADVGTLLDRRAGERISWSAAIQLGIPYTTHTLSVFTTNTATSTLQGTSRGEDRRRYGIELTAFIPVGRFLGWNVSRADAMEAVATEVPRGENMVAASAENYLFFPRRIVVPAGTTVEWTNRDQMVHTVTATDRSWDSGAIQPGGTWRARFDRPGRYPFYCGPHPFMQGVVIVQ